MKKEYIALLFLFLSACCNIDNKRGIDIGMCPVPKSPTVDCESTARKLLKEKVYYPLGIIGEVEPIYIKDMASVFPARIDTGAETSSIDAINVKEFERDGESWVSFDIENKATKERKTFEKKITRKATIKRQQGGDERRITVAMEIKAGNQLFIKEFTLANREKFEYQVLIGRNILNGLAVVDVGIKNSLN